MALWGVDLGGTKIEAVILKSADDPQVILRKRVPTESEGGYTHIIERICALLWSMSREAGVALDKVGFGTPGSLHPSTGLMKNSNTICLNNQPFKEDLRKALGIPVFLANDANCFALAETRMGVVPQVYPEAEVVFGVIMGTGVGGGLVVHNQVINGRNGIGGEWGHNFLDESGGPCYCGKTGCIERVLSGRNLERWHHETFGQNRLMKEIYQAHLMGKDIKASKTINRMLTFFGRALAQVINIVDPDVIVIGGGVGNIDLLYSKGVKEVKKNIFNPQMDTLIVKPALGDSAGVFGAAYLVS
jgi:fructokinase